MIDCLPTSQRLHAWTPDKHETSLCPICRLDTGNYYTWSLEAPKNVLIDGMPSRLLSRFLVQGLKTIYDGSPSASTYYISFAMKHFWSNFASPVLVPLALSF
ncbi:hypothetical protein VTP01DRAFT_8895 [Rhizomucor pusillus]|uniref:uncharacterized protein n=1 Tax=Rhizomucor pusillus TaxID=4840 RepID=UPI0037445362